MCGKSKESESILCNIHKHGQNVSTTPLRQWGFRQCLPFSWTTLRGKHCWHPIAVMGVVDTFRPYPVCLLLRCKCLKTSIYTVWTIYSATTFVEKCRKVVLEKWFCKLGFFFLVNHFSRTTKKIWVCRTTFLEPLFYTFLEKWLQIKWSTDLFFGKDFNPRFVWSSHLHSYARFNSCENAWTEE